MQLGRTKSMVFAPASPELERKPAQRELDIYNKKSLLLLGEQGADVRLMKEMQEKITRQIFTGEDDFRGYLRVIQQAADRTKRRCAALLGE